MIGCRLGFGLGLLFCVGRFWFDEFGACSFVLVAFRWFGVARGFARCDTHWLVCVALVVV